jgi:hypothetical protein
MPFFTAKLNPYWWTFLSQGNINSKGPETVHPEYEQSEEDWRIVEEIAEATSYGGLVDLAFSSEWKGKTKQSIGEGMTSSYSWSYVKKRHDRAKAEAEDQREWFYPDER